MKSVPLSNFKNPRHKCGRNERRSRFSIFTLPSLFLAVLMFFGAGAISRCRAEAVSDIVVGYGASEAGRWGTESALQAAVYAQYANANNVAYNSGTPHRQNIVGFIQSATDCDYLTSTGGMVSWLSGYDSHVTDVLALADSLGADLVTYIFKNGDSVAGVAQQPGRCSAYNDQVYWTYFAHESGGHNFGGNHADAYVSPTTVMANNYCGGGAQGFYTNPNIWLNGVKLLSTGNCTGSPIYGGDTAYEISTAAQGRADAYDRLVYGSYRGALKYRWQFNKPAVSATAGTIFTDEVSGAQAIVRGQGAILTGTALRLPGGTTGNAAGNSISAYIDLPNGIISSSTNFTIEIWAAPLSAQNWMRIIDIGRTTEAGDGTGAAGEYITTGSSAAPGSTSSYDDIMLSGAIGTSLNSQRFEAKLSGSNTVTADSTLTTNAGDLHHYAITFTDTTTGGTVKWYRDGTLINTLKVAFHAASLHDVNNWLGRSLWSGDSMANIDYYDVRIQSVALTDGQVAANYRIGPNDKTVTLWANDAWGNSGWVSGSWEFGQSVPDSTHDYETGTLRLLTPWTTTNSTFPGRSLTVTGGNLYLAGKNAKTATIADLRLNGATVHSFGDNGSTQTLAGKITVPTNTNNQIRGERGPLIVSANIVGGVGGGITYTENAVTLTNSNTGYFGATIIGDGRFSTLQISNETNLGGNPTFYGGAWLQLNRGILVTTQTMTIDDSNRGVLIGPSGGFFRPNAGTTLTIATPINSPAAGNTLQTSPMSSNPTLGILFVDGAGVTEFTNPNNSHNAEMQINAGELRLSGSGRLNNGNHSWPITINALFTDNSVLDQTLGGVISGNGSIVKGGTNSSTLTITGANTFSGSVVVSSGTLYANASNAANGRAFSYVSGITVNSGATLRASSNGLFGWDGTQEHPITVNAGGTLTANGGLGSDLGLGTVTLNSGTMTTLATGATDYGSFRFDEASDQLLVTNNSTVSASNVKFGNASASINVATGKTLNFTGTITDATSGGISYLTKTGNGMLILAGSNNYSGATAINAGTLSLVGSLSGTSAVTVAAGATLTGTGTINGNLSLVSTAIHTPGIGVQSIGGSLSYDAGSRVKFTLSSNSNSTGAATSITATGALTVTSGALIDLAFNNTGSTVNFFDTFWTQSRSWAVVSSSGMTGAFALGTVTNDSNNKAASSYGTFNLTQNATGATLTWSPKPFAAWRGTSFGANAANAATSDFSSDPDRDGIPNAWEYFYNTNPSTTTATPLQTQAVNGHTKLTFPRNTQATDITATIQGANSLNGTWTDLAQSTGGSAFTPLVSGVTVTETGSGTMHTVEFTDPYLTSDRAHPKRFFRLWIQQQ